MKEIKGKGMNKLCAVGKIHFYGHSERKYEKKKASGSHDNISTDLQRLEIALDSTVEELYDGERSAIHEEFHENARLAAFEGYEASEAVSVAAERIFSSLSYAGDPYISEKGVEISRITAELLSRLSKEKIKIAELLPRPVILVCGDVSAEELMTADRAMIQGIFLFGVSPLSELAVFAHSLGVPLIIGDEEDIHDIPCGEMAIIDSEKGTLVISPEAEAVEHYAVRLGSIAMKRGKAIGKKIISHLTFFEENIFSENSVLLQLREERSPEELFLFFSSLLRGGELKIILPHEEKHQNLIISAAIKASENGKIILILPSGTDISAIRAIKYKLYAELLPECKNISVGALIDCGAAAVLMEETAKECDFFAVDSDKLLSSLMYPGKVDTDSGQKAFFKLAEELVLKKKLKGASICFFGMTASGDNICERLISMGADEIAIPFFYLY